MSLVLPQPLQLPEASGYGLGRSLLTAGLVMGAVPAAETAAANSSLNTLMRSIGTSVAMRSIGTSVAGAGSPRGPAPFRRTCRATRVAACGGVEN
ncbi:hypothetical protein [Streptomyces sp. H62]